MPLHETFVAFLAKASEIQRLRYLVLVHSCIYYELSDSLISDAEWDVIAMRLVEMQRLYPAAALAALLHKEFEDFDGNTGFHLPVKKPWVIKKARELLARRRSAAP